MRISAWTRLPGLCHPTMRISTGLEDCLEALDETPDHSRDLVDCAGSDPADLGLALDGRIHEVGSSLKGVVEECAQSKSTVQPKFTTVGVIESHVTNKTTLQLSSEFNSATKCRDITLVASRRLPTFPSHIEKKVRDLPFLVDLAKRPVIIATCEKYLPNVCCMGSCRGLPCGTPIRHSTGLEFDAVVRGQVLKAIVSH